jgi:hypothetical protein
MTDAAQRELREAWRSVANCKVNEFRRQCWRVAGLVRTGVVSKADAVDALFTIAIAHALIRALGEDRIEAIIAEAFSGVSFGPVRAEVAA